MFSYSSDEMIFHGEYETKEAALIAAREEHGMEPGDTVFVGENIPLKPGSYLPDADDLIDQIAERVGDQVGEVAEDYLSHVTKQEKLDLSEKIQTAVTQWMARHSYTPQYYTVENQEELKVPGQENSQTSDPQNTSIT